MSGSARAKTSLRVFGKPQCLSGLTWGSVAKNEFSSDRDAGVGYPAPWSLANVMGRRLDRSDT